MSKCKYIKNKRELSHNLRKFRNVARLSQQQVADALEINRSTYSYWETSKTTPDIFTLISLSKIFGIDLLCLTGKSCGNLQDAG